MNNQKILSWLVTAGTPAVEGGRSARWTTWICLLLSLAYVLTATNFPVVILANFTHDDAYFANCAKNIVNGDWLGRYSQERLIKGPGYPLFLALTHTLGLPLALMTALLHLGACIACVRMLRKAGLPPLFCLLLYLVLLFQPAFFPQRVLRDYFNNSLILYAFSGALYIVLAGERAVRRFVCLFGLACGFMLITREDQQWLLFTMALLVLCRLVQLRRNKAGLRSFGICIALYVCSACLPPFIVSCINKHKYNVFAVTEIHNASYKKAIAALYRVSVGPEIPHVPVGRAKMEAIFEVSPSFGLLKPYFTDQGLGWTVMGEAFFRNMGESFQYPSGEYAADHFMWALRSAVATLGHYRDDAQKAAAFYDRLAAEIDQACRNQTVTCRFKPIGYLPNLPDGFWREIPLMLKEFYRNFTYLNPVPALRRNGGGSEGQAFIRDYFTVTKRYDYPLRLAGWYHAPAADWFVIMCYGRDPIRPERRESPDIARVLGDPRANMSRFDLSIEYPEQCYAVFDDPAMPGAPLPALRSYAAPDKTRTLMIDVRDQIPLGWSYSLVQRLCPVFRYINIILFVLGSIALVLETRHCRKTGNLTNDLTLAYFLWLAFYARFGFLLLVAIGGYWTTFPHYMLPMWAFMAMAALFSLSLTARRLAGSR